jgi:prephenate dehydrogenase
VRWKKITLVGVGLLGGSLGMAVRERKLAASITGYVRRPASVRECERFGAVNKATLDLAEAARDADLLVLCTPIARMRPLLAEMLPALKPGAIITDVGSVKANVVRELQGLAAKAGAHFVGSHPMAGAEKTGVSAARADLFENAVCVVTPAKKSNQTAVAKVVDFWRSVGAKVLELSPEEHDVLVSRSSHLPHLVAAALANLVLAPGHPKEQALLCANGFRDTTRIASGSPEMWRDIALSNRKNLLRALATLVSDLEKFRRNLQAGKAVAVENFFSQAKQRRDKWARSAAPQSSPE